MPNTKLLYLENFMTREREAKVLEVGEDNGKTIVLLDQTIFYPQGGGQPYDKGIIESASGKFAVEEVRFLDGTVRHIGHFESGSFKKGDIATCKIEKGRRELNSRLHSAGHLVDMALSTLKPDWIPGKGYHFPDGPYVEYHGILNAQETEKLKAEIEQRANELIQKGAEVAIRFADKKEMTKLCRFVPDYIPEGKPGRVVLFGNFGVPCGGTHVKYLSELKSMTIRKIKQDGDNVRISYDILR